MIPGLDPSFIFKTSLSTELPKVSKDDPLVSETLSLFVKIKLLEAFSETWKTISETFRKQAKESSENHKVRQKKSKERKAIERNQEHIQLIRRQADAFHQLESGNIDRQLQSPI